jgi:hypothetical protein
VFVNLFLSSLCLYVYHLSYVVFVCVFFIVAYYVCISIHSNIFLQWLFLFSPSLLHWCFHFMFQCCNSML